MNNDTNRRGYSTVFGKEESSSSPAFGSADLYQPYAHFPLSRPMSPPVRSKYATTTAATINIAPPPRANSTPPNNNNQILLEDYDSLMMSMKQLNIDEKVCPPPPPLSFIY